MVGPMLSWANGKRRQKEWERTSDTLAFGSDRELEKQNRAEGAGT